MSRSERLRQRCPHSRRGQVRSGVGILRSTTMVLLASTALFLLNLVAPASALAVTASSPSACPSLELSNQAWEREAQIDQTRAAGLASGSSVFQDVVSNLGTGVSVSLENTFDLWHVDTSTCTPVLNSVDVVFGATTSSVFDTIVVSENPLLTFVENLTIQSDAALGGTPSAAYGLWTGWIAETSGYVDAEWTVPTISASSGCYNGCSISFWVGQTASYGGGSGISQTGTYQQEELIPGFGWYYVQWAWYEFWPNNPYEVNCFPVAHGDVITAESNYYNGQYWTSVWDASQQEGCTANQGMSMGAPTYANWIGEDPVQYPCDCNWPTPPFTTMQFTGMTTGSGGDIGSLPHSSITQATNVALGPLNYVPKARPPFSYFTESYT